MNGSIFDWQIFFLKKKRKIFLYMHDNSRFIRLHCNFVSVIYISVTECVKNYFLWELLCSRRVEFKWREIRKVNIIFLYVKECFFFLLYWNSSVWEFNCWLYKFYFYFFIICSIFVVCVFEVVSYNLGHVFYYIRLVFIVFSHK